MDAATKDFMEKLGARFVPSSTIDKNTDPEDISRELLWTDRNTVGQIKALNKNPARFGMSYLTHLFTRKEIFPDEKHAASKPESNPLKVFGLLNEQFGREWFDWEPETLWATFGEGAGIKMSGSWKNVILALQTLVATNQAHEHWHIFENTVHAFNMNPVDFGTLQPCEMDDIAKAMKIMNTIRPKTEYEPEIYGYIASCARASGVVYLPPEFFGEAAQAALDNLNNDVSLANKVKAIWPDKLTGSEDVDVKVQYLRLKEIKEEFDTI